MLGDLACPAADVQDALCAAKVEASLAQQPVAQMDVQRKQAGRGQQSALRPTIYVADLLAIFVVTDPADQVVLEQLEDSIGTGRPGRLGPFFAGGQQRL